MHDIKHALPTTVFTLILCKSNLAHKIAILGIYCKFNFVQAHHQFYARGFTSPGELNHNIPTGIGNSSNDAIRTLLSSKAGRVGFSSLFEVLITLILTATEALLKQRNYR